MTTPSLAPAPALAARAANPAFFNATAVPLSSADDWTVCVASTDKATDECCASVAAVRCPVWGCRLSLKEHSQQASFTTCTDKASSLAHGGRKRTCKAYQAAYDDALKQLNVGAGWWASAPASGEVVCTAFGGKNESAGDCCSLVSGKKQAENADKNTPETCLIADKDKAQYETCVQEKHDAYAVCTSSVSSASATAAKGAASSAPANAASSAAHPAAARKTRLALAALALSALGAL